MRIGKHTDLGDLAAEIELQRVAKKDYLAPSVKLRVLSASRTQVGSRNELHVARNGDELVLGIKDLAHEQLAEKLGIPRKYYDRIIGEAPELWERNVNHWLQVGEERHMVRTMNGNVRAFLSDRYRPLENEELAEVVLPVLSGTEIQIISAEITERRLYIKGVEKGIRKDIPTGRYLGDASHTFFDTVSPAIVISNSEVGCGALSIETGIWTKVCTNLAITSQRSMRKYHIGGRWEAERGYELMSDQTRKLTDAALWAQVHDVVAGAFDRAKFDALVGEVAELAELKVEGDPTEVIELVAKEWDLTEGERGGVLRHLIEGGDLTHYGVFNAITATAEDVEEYDRATDFERFGGEFIAKHRMLLGQ